MANTCWNCKHNVLEVKVLTPQNSEDNVLKNKAIEFQSDIVAIVKGNKGEYSAWYRSDGEIKLFSFQILQTCLLELKKNKENIGCLRYEDDLDTNVLGNTV